MGLRDRIGRNQLLRTEPRDFVIVHCAAWNMASVTVHTDSKSMVQLLLLVPARGGCAMFLYMASCLACSRTFPLAHRASARKEKREVLTVLSCAVRNGVVYFGAWSYRR